MKRDLSIARSDNSNRLKPAVNFVARPYWRGLVLMTGASFIGGMTEALFLVLVTRVAFAVTEGAERVGVVANWYVTTNQALLFGLALVILRMLLSGLAIWESTRISSAAVARIRHRLTRGFIGSKWEVQQAQEAGSLQELIRGFSTQASGVIGGLTGMLVATSNFVAMLALAVAIDPIGAAVMIASVVVFGSALRPMRAAVRRRAQAHNAANMQLGTTAHEIAQLGMELHVFHVQAQARERLGERIEQVRHRANRLGLANSMTSTIYSGLAFLALLAALGVVSASDGADLTSLGAVMLVMLRSLTYGQAIQSSYVNLSSSAPAMDEVMDRLAYFDQGSQHDGGQPVGRIGRIVVDHATFSYGSDAPALDDVSFAIEPHEVVGIVGPSGGGKSTLVQLLLGLRDPQQGRIFADGRDVRDLDKAEWARKVTFVPQAAHLINGSIADNIRFLRDGFTAEQVEQAARLASLHEDVMHFPERYDRPVGNLGAHLSGGQQQRLCIARALLEQPDLLILDEPTSSLDVKSEHLIRSTLLDLRQQVTIVIIAHRLSTLDICDRIMVIKDGRLVGFDTPDRLEQSDEFYREALELSGLR
jgi:ATP-binding cassette subfamily B protein